MQIPYDIKIALADTQVGLSVSELAARTDRNAGAVRRIIAKAKAQGLVTVARTVNGTPYYRNLVWNDLSDSPALTGAPVA